METAATHLRSQTTRRVPLGPRSPRRGARPCWRSSGLLPGVQRGQPLAWGACGGGVPGSLPSGPSPWLSWMPAA